MVVGAPEEPGDHGFGRHLGSHLAGDAAQLEALVGHGLRVRVHLHAGAAAQAGCRARRNFCQFLPVAGSQVRGQRGEPRAAVGLQEEPRRFLSVLAGKLSVLQKTAGATVAVVLRASSTHA